MRNQTVRFFGLIGEKAYRVRFQWALLNSSWFIYQELSRFFQLGMATASTDFLWGLFGNLLFWYLAYYFAYQKHGTKWLSVSLVFGMIQVAGQGIRVFYLDLGLANCAVWMFDFFYSLVWCLAVFRLRKINQQVRLEMWLAKKSEHKTVVNSELVVSEIMDKAGGV